MYQRLFNLYLNFLAHESLVIDQIKAYEGNVYIEQNALIFSLADLFDFLQSPSRSESSKEDKIDYKNFQRLLYQSKLNQDLKAYGGQVVVHASTGKVETNLYRLERCSPTDHSL